MANVDPVDGIKYGFQLVGYVAAVFIIGGLIIRIGTQSGGEVGGLFALLGVAVIFAGLLGVQYKIIADGVEKGVLAARRRREYRQPEDREGTQSQEGYQSGQSIQDQQGQQRFPDQQESQNQQTSQRQQGQQGFPDQQGSQAGPDERQDEKNSQG